MKNDALRRRRKVKKMSQAQEIKKRDVRACVCRRLLLSPFCGAASLCCSRAHTRQRDKEAEGKSTRGQRQLRWLSVTCSEPKRRAAVLQSVESFYSAHQL